MTTRTTSGACCGCATVKSSPHRTARAGGDVRVRSRSARADRARCSHRCTRDRRSPWRSRVPKGDRPELIVQKLTEIGADVIIPMMTARSIVRWDAPRARKHGERLSRVAREAAMQSRRTRLPLVEPLTSFTEVVTRPGAALAVPGGTSPTVSTPLVLIGPEGGWSPAELDAAPATGRAGRPGAAGGDGGDRGVHALGGGARPFSRRVSQKNHSS